MFYKHFLDFSVCLRSLTDFLLFPLVWQYYYYKLDCVQYNHSHSWPSNFFSIIDGASSSVFSRGVGGCRLWVVAKDSLSIFFEWRGAGSYIHVILPHDPLCPLVCRLGGLSAITSWKGGSYTCCVCNAELIFWHCMI